MISALVLDATDGVTGSTKYGTTAPTGGGKLPGGRPRSGLFPIKATAKTGTAVVTWVVGIVGSHTGSTGTWVTLLSYRAKESPAVARFTHTITASDGASVYDALMTENSRDWPHLAISYITTGGDMASGDELFVWQEAA